MKSKIIALMLVILLASIVVADEPELGDKKKPIELPSASRADPFKKDGNIVATIDGKLETLTRESANLYSFKGKFYKLPIPKAPAPGTPGAPAPSGPTPAFTTAPGPSTDPSDPTRPIIPTPKENNFMYFTVDEVSGKYNWYYEEKKADVPTWGKLLTDQQKDLVEEYKDKATYTFTPKEVLPPGATDILLAKYTDNGNEVQIAIAADKQTHQTIYKDKDGNSVSKIIRYKWEGTGDDAKFNQFGDIEFSGLDMGDVKVPYSEDWNIRKGKLYFKSSEVEDVDRANNLYTLKDGSELHSFTNAEGKTAFWKKGEDGNIEVYNGKDSISITPEEAKKLFGEDLKEIDVNIAMHYKNFNNVLYDNRFDLDDLERTKAGEWKAPDGSIFILDKDTGKITLKPNPESEDYYEYDKSGNLITSNTDGLKTEFTYDKDGNLNGMLLDGKELERKQFEDKSITLFCDGTYCYDPVRGNVFKETTEGTLEDCTTKECQDLMEQLKAKADKDKYRRGGPTSTEQTWLDITNLLEASQTGFGSFVSLFLSDDFLEEWAQEVDEFFCDTILFGGIDCWTSYVCESQAPVSQEGALVIETGAGHQPIAHAEAERHHYYVPDQTDEQENYLYKISFGVRNPQGTNQDINFSVILKNPEYEVDYSGFNIEPTPPYVTVQTPTWVSEGDVHSKAGANVISKYYNETYDQICLLFHPALVDKEGNPTYYLCNPITII